MGYRSWVIGKKETANFFLPITHNPLPMTYCSSPLKPPEIRGLEKEAFPGLQVIVSREIIPLILLPLELFIGRAVADIDHGAGDVGKGGQQVDVQLLVIGVVFRDTTQEQVLVKLEGQAVAHDRVVVYFLGVRFAEKIGEAHGKVIVQFLDRLEHQAETGNGTLALEGIVEIVVDQVAAAYRRFKIELVEDLHVTLDAPGVDGKALVGEDLVANDGVEADLALARHGEANDEDVPRFVQATEAVARQVAPVEGLDLLEKIRTRIEGSDDEPRQGGQSDAAHVADVGAEILADIVEARFDVPLARIVVVAHTHRRTAKRVGAASDAAERAEGVEFQYAGRGQAEAAVGSQYAIVAAGELATSVETAQEAILVQRAFVTENGEGGIAASQFRITFFGGQLARELVKGKDERDHVPAADLAGQLETK